LFGIRPWEWDELTAGEVFSLIDYVDKQNKRGVDGGDL
jgi:hypothetical protein